MDNTSKILGVSLILTLIYIIFLKGCGDKHSCPKSEIIEVDTVRNEITIDTIRIVNTDTIYKYISIKVPVPYHDTTFESKVVTVDNFDDFITEQPWIYQDTIRDDTMSINYWIRSWGYIDSISVGYRPLAQYYIEKKSVLELEVVKKKRFNGFYVGMDVDIRESGVTRPTPVIEVSTAKVNYSLGYNVSDKELRAGLRFKLGK